MRRSLSLTLASIGIASALAQPAFAQTPTAAQQQAIRSSCVSDYRANCSDVQPHGMAALVCLEQHESKLSPACKSAVEAVGGGSTAAAAPSSSTEATAPAKATAPASTSETATASADTEKATGQATGQAKAAPAPIAQAAGGAPEMSFRQEMRIAAHACARDFRLFCPNLPVGHGNVLFCLKVHGPRLDAPCRNALTAAGVEF